jgi:hypothetical protein
MPETTITIDRDQRDGLYEVISNHLALVQDFWVAMERTKDGATAERLGLEAGLPTIERPARRRILAQGGR